jgi:FkbM family methyltransferase
MSVLQIYNWNHRSILQSHLLNTRQKIALASLLFRVVRIVRSRLLRKSNRSVCKRNGIFWELDLQEGIDFSIWLLGGFELKTMRLYKVLIKKGDIVLDIGANVGAHTLPFAKIVGPCGKVYAFEPTEYAFRKLLRNVSLNHDLYGQVNTVQAMLLNENNQDHSPSFLYSSWPLIHQEDLHKQHRGRLMTIKGAEKTSLDDFVNRTMINRVDFIKIDVDGNEIDVLQGSWGTIQKFRPIILMEFAPYLFENNKRHMEKILSDLVAIGYEVRDAATQRLLPCDLHSLERIVPDYGSINILLQHHVNKDILCQF